MSPEDAALDRLLAERLWPWVEQVMDAWALPGVAICAVRGEAVVARGFGTRDVRTGEPVTGDTLFHLASISKPFVATAALQLVDDGALELDAPIAPLLPELRWADERARGITLRHLLSHRSGLGDVHDYGWDDPEFDDDALARFAAEVAGWRLERDPGNAFAYSNAAYELLGHLLATVTGSSFEALLAERVLRPLGMATSTFLRHDVPPALEAAPHIGQPAAVPEGAYPYTRQHAPSSSLHSSAAELGRWLVAHLDGRAGLSPELHREMWAPQAEAGGVWHAQIALGWFLGTIRGRTVVSHSGEDPGFATNHGLVPDERVGFAVLGNSNLVPVELSEATLAVLLGEDPGEPPLPPAVVPVGRELEVAGPKPPRRCSGCLPLSGRRAPTSTNPASTMRRGPRSSCTAPSSCGRCSSCGCARSPSRRMRGRRPRGPTRWRGVRPRLSSTSAGRSSSTRSTRTPPRGCGGCGRPPHPPPR